MDAGQAHLGQAAPVFPGGLEPGVIVVRIPVRFDAQWRTGSLTSCVDLLLRYIDLHRRPHLAYLRQRADG